MAEAQVSMPQGSGEHPINWVEFVARDLERASSFFGRVFDWPLHDFSENYRTFVDSSGFAGGINAGRPEQPLRSFVYIRVGDVTAALEKCAQAGGEILVPKTLIDEESTGGIGFFKDPSGVIMGLSDIEMHNIPTPTPFGPDKPRHGSLCGAEFYGGDFELTRPFYSELFGWAFHETMPGYMNFGPGRGISGVFQGHTPAAHTVLYVWVDDMADTIARIKANGGTLMCEPMAAPGYGTFAYYTDSEGAMQGLIAR